MAQLELRRQGVRDFSSAMATADGLVDFNQNKEGGKNKSPSSKTKAQRSKVMRSLSSRGRLIIRVKLRLLTSNPTKPTLVASFVMVPIGQESAQRRRS